MAAFLTAAKTNVYVAVKQVITVRHRVKTILHHLMRETWCCHLSDLTLHLVFLW